MMDTLVLGGLFLCAVLEQVDVVEEAKRRALAEADAAHRRRADELEAALEDALRRRRDAEEDGRAALERQRRDKDDQLEHLQHVTDPRFGIDIVYFRSLDVLYLSNSANLVSHFKDNNEILLENRSFHVL